MSSDVDASEVFALARDLGKLSAGAATMAYDVVREGAGDLRDTWRRNARLTAGQHGKYYPDSITFDMRIGTGIRAEIGPDPRLRQGDMSFEDGSVNQPPHLDGQRATDEVVPRVERRLDTGLALLLAGNGFDGRTGLAGVV